MKTEQVKKNTEKRMSASMLGTPKSIEECLHNAINDMACQPKTDPIEIIRTHLKEFMATKFSIAELKGLTPREIFHVIFKD